MTFRCFLYIFLSLLKSNSLGIEQRYRHYLIRLAFHCTWKLNRYEICSLKALRSFLFLRLLWYRRNRETYFQIIYLSKKITLSVCLWIIKSMCKITAAFRKKENSLCHVVSWKKTRFYMKSAQGYKRMLHLN